MRRVTNTNVSPCADDACLSFSREQTTTGPAYESLRTTTSTSTTTTQIQTGLNNNGFSHSNLYDRLLQSVNSSQNHITSYYQAVRINNITNVAQSDDHSHTPSVVKLAFEPQNQQPRFLFITPAGYRYPSLISASDNSQYGQPRLAYDGHFTILNRGSGTHGTTLSTATYTVSGCQSACSTTTPPSISLPTSSGIPPITPSLSASLPCASPSSIQKKSISCNMQTGTFNTMTTYASDPTLRTHLSFLNPLPTTSKLPPISFKSRKLYVDSIGGTPYLTKSSFQQFAYGKVKQKRPRSNKKAASTCLMYRSPEPCNVNVQSSCNSMSTLPASCPTAESNYNCFSTTSYLPHPPSTNQTSEVKSWLEFANNHNLELPAPSLHHPCANLQNQDTELVLDINDILEMEESMASNRPPFSLVSGNGASGMLNVPNYSSEEMSGLHSSTELSVPSLTTNKLTNVRHSIVTTSDVFPRANSSPSCNTLALKDVNGHICNDDTSLQHSNNGDGIYLSAYSGTLKDESARPAASSTAVIGTTTTTSATTATISEVFERPRALLSSANSTVDFYTAEEYLRSLERSSDALCSQISPPSISSVKVTPLTGTPPRQTRTALYRSRKRLNCNSTPKVSSPNPSLMQMLNASKVTSTDIRHGLDETIESTFNFMQSESESKWSSDNEELQQRFGNLNHDDDFIKFDSCCAGQSIDMERVMDDMMRLQESLLVELSTFASKDITDGSKL